MIQPLVYTISVVSLFYVNKISLPYSIIYFIFYPDTKPLFQETKADIHATCIPLTPTGVSWVAKARRRLKLAAVAGGQKLSALNEVCAEETVGMEDTQQE